jgi:hypothetical protein
VALWSSTGGSEELTNHGKITSMDHWAFSGLGSINSKALGNGVINCMSHFPEA